MVFGKHLILDANVCKGDITNKYHIQNFINELVILCKMQKKGETLFEYFPENEFNMANDLVGYSVCQIISLSNITLHINFISKTFYFDFFSCKEIDIDLVVNLFDKYFKPKTIKKIILQRDAIDLTLPFY
jgi:hypothetical protein